MTLTAGYVSGVVVREALLTDMDWLVEQLRAFAKFFTSKFSLFPDDEALVREKMAGLITHHFVRVADLGNIPIGFIAGAHSEHWFNPKLKTFTELFWWVVPEHRGTTAGVRLLNAFIDHGEQFPGWIVFGLEHNSPVRDETLLKRGFRHQERSFLKEVE